MSMIRVAAAAYPIEKLVDWAAYEAKITRWVGDAVEAGAQVLVFPEYAGMELTALLGDALAADLQRSIDALGPLLETSDALHRSLAKKHGIVLVAGSAPVRLAPGRAVNRAHVFGPAGHLGHQDKLIPTRWERDPWGITGQGPARVFETPFGRFGICICYDAEFPMIARAMVEGGAQYLLVPSCTERLSGYWRVRVGAMARALEGQCVAVHAPLIGTAAWSPAVDTNTGAAGVYGPSDNGFPADGVLALGGIDVAGWTFAEIDLAQIEEIRADGAVLGVAHWAEQAERLGENGDPA
ncbi:MAG: carbon-nitrogen hydrolase family protein [Pseudomonadota bacterium]